MKNLILLFGMLMMGYSVTSQITDPSYKSKVVELMNIQTGQNTVMDEMVENLSTNITDDKKADFKKDMKAVMDKLLDRSANIYMEVYTKKEVDALLAFYKTPVGQEIKEKMPEVVKKSTKMGQEFSMELMPIIQKYMN